MKSPALLLFAAFLSSPSFGADWTVRADASSLRFSGVSQGEAFEGSFAEFTPQIRFDPAALAGSRFDVRIKLGSANTRNEERDMTLQDSDFFDVANHPEAHFVATDFAATATGFEARGALELRGVRQPVTLAFAWAPLADGARLEGKATLDRTAFGVGAGGDWADAETIAHEVVVETILVLAPASTP